MCQALKEIRKEAFGYANIEGNDEKTCHYTGLPTYSVFTLFDLFKLMLQVHHPKERTELKISFVPH